MSLRCREGEPLGSFRGYGLSAYEKKTLLQPAINATCGDKCPVSCKIKFAKRVGSKSDISQAKSIIESGAFTAIVSSRQQS